MTRITNADQVLMLLRSHLQRAERSRRSSKPVGAETSRRTALERVQDIAAAQQSSEEDLHRALVAGILAEEFGPGFANDARFQDMVSTIIDIISRDDQSRDLFSKAIAQLSSQG